MAAFINDFLKALTNIQNSQRIPLIVKSLLESLANCYPLIRIDPEILYVLAKIHSTWNSASFYLEVKFIKIFFLFYLNHFILKIFLEITHFQYRSREKLLLP